jgi:hypothetical protein
MRLKIKRLLFVLCGELNVASRCVKFMRRSRNALPSLLSGPIAAVGPARQRDASGTHADGRGTSSMLDSM